MTSSGSSLTFRIERRPPPAGSLITALALLAGVALALSDLDWPIAAMAWATAVAVSSIELHRRRRLRPAAIELLAPDALRLHWRGGEDEDVRLVRWQRLGPLVLIDVEGRRRLRLEHWLAGLPVNACRRLLRHLARMRPAGDGSV